MRALQLCLKNQWDFLDLDKIILWDYSCLQDLLWWSVRPRLEEGISLKLPIPDLMFWSDASDKGWGAQLDTETVSGLWSQTERETSINARELLAIEKGLIAFQPHLLKKSIAVFCDNSTAVAYLRNLGGTLSPSLNSIAQRILRWVEERESLLLPQFIKGSHNVTADSLSRPGQAIGTEWVLHQEMFDFLNKRWPVTIDLFATYHNRRLDAYFAPTLDPMAVGTDAMLQCWSNMLVYAFPPFSMIRTSFVNQKQH